MTPLDSLRRLVAIVRLIDAKECPELYNQLQGEIAVAERVLAQPFEVVLVYGGGSSTTYKPTFSGSGACGGAAGVSFSIHDGVLYAGGGSHGGAAGGGAGYGTAGGMSSACGGGNSQSSHAWKAPSEAAQPSKNALADEVIAALDALNIGCTEQSWIGWQNGDGEEVGTRLQAAIDAYKASQPSSGSAAPSGEVAVLPEKMSPEMREAMWEAITRHGGSNLEYWIEDLYNDIRAFTLTTNKD